MTGSLCARCGQRTRPLPNFPPTYQGPPTTRGRLDSPLSVHLDGKYTFTVVAKELFANASYVRVESFFTKSGRPAGDFIAVSSNSNMGFFRLYTYASWWNTNYYKGDSDNPCQDYVQQTFLHPQLQVHLRLCLADESLLSTIKDEDNLSETKDTDGAKLDLIDFKKSGDEKRVPLCGLFPDLPQAGVTNSVLEKGSFRQKLQQASQKLRDLFEIQRESWSVGPALRYQHVVERGGKPALYNLRLVKVVLKVREEVYSKSEHVQRVLQGHKDFWVYLYHCREITPTRRSQQRTGSGLKALSFQRAPVFCTILFCVPRDFRATRFGLVSSYLHLGMYINKPFDYPDQSAGFGRPVPGLTSYSMVADMYQELFLYKECLERVIGEGTSGKKMEVA